MSQEKNRKSIRLSEYDYTLPGAYFVTIVTYQRKCILGAIRNGEIILSNIGRIVNNTWQEIPIHFPNATVDNYVIMPNHIHGIVNILDTGVGARHASPLRGKDPLGTSPRSLGVIIGSFKSAATKRIHQTEEYKKIQVWHRNYYEHVIRDERDYEKIVEYIITNPANWMDDPDYRS